MTDSSAAQISALLESISFDSLDLKFFERFDGQSRTWNFHPHTHNFFEFIYFIEGRAHIEAGSATLEASLSDLVVYPPFVTHQERLENDIRQEIYCFWVDVGPTFPLDRGLILKDSSGLILKLIEVIYTQYMSPRHFTKELIAVSIQALFLFLRQYFAEIPQDHTSLVERCLRYIHEHYTDEFTIEDMAKAVYVSPSYLFRSFKDKMHSTPMQYRNVLRVEKSKLLLCDGNNRRIDIIAQETGFSDVKYFSHLFKKITGFTPGGFRKRHTSIT